MICIFLFSLFTILTSFVLGILIKSTFNVYTNHQFVSPLGFVVLLGVLTVIYYPLLTYHIETKTMVILTLLVYLAIYLFAIFKFKSLIPIIKSYRCYTKELLAGIIVFAVFLVIYYYVKFPTRTDDLYFYIPYVLGKIKETTISATLYNQYDFQMFYNFVAVWGRIAISSNALSNILPEAFVVWFPSIILYWILSFVMIDVLTWMKLRVKSYWKVWIVYLIVFLYTIGSYWYLQTPYIGNSFRRITIIPIFFLLMSIAKKFDWKTLLICTLCFFSLISQTSTGFIFSAIMLYAFMLYNAKNKKNNYLISIAILAIPASMYITRLSPQFAPYFMLIYVLFFLLYIGEFIPTVEYLLSKIWIVALIAVPLAFSIFPYTPLYVPKTFNMSYFDVSPYFFDPHAYEGIENLFEFGFDSVTSIITTMFCALVWFYVLWFVAKGLLKNKSDNYFEFHIFVILLTFFNPFVMTFVMTYITDVVYFRIYDMFFNILTIIVLISSFVDTIDFRKSLFFLLVTAVCFLNEVPKNQTWGFMGINDDDFNPLYHVDNIDIETLSLFSKYITDHEIQQPVTIVSQIYSPSAFSTVELDNVKDNLLTVDSNDQSDEAEFQRIVYRYEPGLDEVKPNNYLKYCLFAQDRNVQYTIIDAQYNQDLENAVGYCGEKVIENGQYRIFEMHYEWLEWSKPLGE